MRRFNTLGYHDVEERLLAEARGYLKINTEAYTEAVMWAGRDQNTSLTHIKEAIEKAKIKL